MVPTRIISAVAAVAGVLAMSSPASATTFCVADQTCNDAGGIPEANLDSALSGAAGSFGVDRIEIGPGDFHTTTGWAYDTAAVQNAVNIVGAGAGQTRLIRDTASANTFALKLTGKPASSVSDLSVVVATEANAYVHDGLDLSGSATRLELVSTANQGAAARIEANSALTDSKVTTSSASSAGVSLVGDKAILAGSDVDAQNGEGIGATGTGTRYVTRTRVRARDALTAFGGGTTYVDNSELHAIRFGIWASTSPVHGLNLTIAGAAPTAVGARVQGPGTLTIDNSILYGLGTSIETTAVMSVVTARFSDYADPINPGPGTIDESDHVQHVDPGFVGGDLHLRADSPLLDAGTGAPKDGQLGLQDLSGAPRSVDATASGIATPDLGAYEFQPHAPSAGIEGPDSVVAGMPATFASAPSSDSDPGDSLSAHWSLGGSPADGAEVTRSFTSPGTVTIDLTVTDRSGRTATATRTLEVQPAPVVTPSEGPLTLTALSVTRHRFKVGRRHGTAFRFLLSKDARVRIALARRVKGKRHPAGKLSRAGRLGANRIAFKGRVGKRALKPGRYVAALTAVDAGGRKSATRRVRFTVIGH